MAEKGYPKVYGLSGDIPPLQIDITRNLYDMHDQPVELNEDGIRAFAADIVTHAIIRHILPAILSEVLGPYIDSESQITNGEPAYGDVGGKPFDQVMAEWDALIQEVRESK